MQRLPLVCCKFSPSGLHFKLLPAYYTSHLKWLGSQSSGPVLFNYSNLACSSVESTSLVQKVQEKSHHNHLCHFNSRRYSRFSNSSEFPKHHPEDGELVYVGTLHKLVKFVKFFSLSTSIAGLILQPILYQHAASLHWIFAVMIGSIAGFFIYLSPLLLHLVTKRYVTKIYLRQDDETFTATTYSLFLREKKHVFAASDVTIPQLPGLFSTIKIHNKTPLFIDGNLFLSRDAYVLLMKYDEPLDITADDDKDK